MRGLPSSGRSCAAASTGLSADLFPSVSFLFPVIVGENWLGPFGPSAKGDFPPFCAPPQLGLGTTHLLQA